MSRCKHHQYHFLTELPSCPRCKSQMTLVLARYEGGTEREEWECVKCSKVIPNTIFNVKFDEFEQFLNQKYGYENYWKKNKKQNKGRKKWKK